MTQQETTFHRLNLETMQDDRFNEWVANFVSMKKDTDWNIEQMAIAEKEAEDKLIYEQKKLEEELAEQKRKQEAQQKIIDDAAKAQAYEIAAFKNERMESRDEILKSMGLDHVLNHNNAFNQPVNFYSYRTTQNINIHIVDYNEVYQANSTEWTALFTVIKTKVQEAFDAEQTALKAEKEAFEKEQERKKVEQQQLEDAAKLKADNDLATKNKADAEAKEKKEKEEAEAEAERVANLIDKDKMAEWAKKLSNIEQPIMKTKKWTSIKNELSNLIDSYIKETV
jgi:hypothetical protein